MEKQQVVDKSKEKLAKGKRGLQKVVFGRTGIIAGLCLVQVGLLLLLYHYLNQYVFGAYWVMVFLGFVLVVGLIGGEGNPAFHIAWIVLILVFPAFGALFYLYFHTQVDGRRLNKRMMAETHATADLVRQDASVLEDLREDSRQMANLVSYVQNISRTGVHKNTEATYFRRGEDFMETLLVELQKAEKFIFLEYFIIARGYMLDSVLDILRQKVKEGVEVRFLYDGTNELFNTSKDFPEELEKDGIACRVFSPVVPVLSTVQNNRDHRKILVIDGKVAFTGGLNLADEYINRKERFGYWKDCAILFRGDAAQSFTLMFLRMWEVVISFPKCKSLPGIREHYLPYLDQMDTKAITGEGKDTASDESKSADALEQSDAENLGYILPYDDNPLDGEQVGEQVYMDIICTATSYVHIMTPYLVLDHEMMGALKYAARRGVDVKIIMPHVPDKKYAFLLARTYYNELLAAGVEIWEFIPGFVHAKLMVSDDEKAVVGSVNMDFRSFYLSFESAALLYRNPEIAKIEKDVQDTLAQSVRVTPDVYNKQPVIHKICGKLLRLFAPLI